MKLIIDIDEGDYKWIKDHVMTVNEQMIANGIPLDKIRAEIEQAKRTEPDVSDYQWNDGIEKALEIIDKYRGDEITEHYKKLGEYYNKGESK